MYSSTFTFLDDARRSSHNNNDPIQLVSSPSSGAWRRRRLGKDDAMYASDDEEINGDDDDFVHARRPHRLSSPSQSRCRFSKGAVLCIDVNYTLVDSRDKPYPSAEQFYNLLSSQRDYSSVLVIYTHANDHYIRDLMSRDLSFFKPDLIITSDTLTAHGYPPKYNKPVTLVRKLLSSVESLSYPFVIIDDNDRNLDATQYDVVMSMTDYHKWPSNCDTRCVENTVDANYRQLANDLKREVDNFYVNKRVT